MQGLSREELLALALSQATTIAHQRDIIAKLTDRVAALERVVSRNSGNSSMPPSGDDQPGRAKPAPRPAKGSGRPRGKQRGAPGSGLSWSESPDRSVPHFPDGPCPCGAALAGAADLGVERSHQVHDVPLVTVSVTQHDLHRVRCGCGREHVAPRPDELVGAPVSYGRNLVALVVYLLVFQHIPVARCAQLVADVTGATPSVGFVHSMLARSAGMLAEVVAQIKTAITLAHVVGFDETTLRVGPAGVKKYVLSANTELLTAFYLGGRDLASFHNFGILPAFAGIAVHDRYRVYDHRDFAGLAGHQLCVAHLLRDLADAAEVYPKAEWPAQADRALRGLISAWHDARAAGATAIPLGLREHLVVGFHQAVLVGLSEIAPIARPGAKQRPARSLLECLRDRQDDVLRFCIDTAVWPNRHRGLADEQHQ